ncbi:MAG TPA: response regulator, partial [Geomobilimonas sp.]|nr:response regulator [Geomobilimonas sp.]
MAAAANERELWIVGLGDRPERGEIVGRYLAAAGYGTRIAEPHELASGRPLGVVLDLSPHSTDGWGILLA